MSALTSFALWKLLRLRSVRTNLAPVRSNAVSTLEILRQPDQSVPGPGLELHPAERVDVRVAVPEVGLHVGYDDLPGRLAEVPLGEELRWIAAMPKMVVLGDRHGIEGDQIGLVVVDLDLFADEDLVPPVVERDVVVVDHGHDLGGAGGAGL